MFILFHSWDQSVYCRRKFIIDNRPTILIWYELHWFFSIHKLVNIGPGDGIAPTKTKSFRFELLHWNHFLLIHDGDQQCACWCASTRLYEAITWWRHQMEKSSALLTICAGNSPVTGEFSAQMPVTRSFDVSFDLLLNERLSKQWWGWWFETPLRPVWRHCNDIFKDKP